jgi:t-SNARE complex subunit (syntaxin)
MMKNMSDSFSKQIASLTAVMEDFGERLTKLEEKSQETDVTTKSLRAAIINKVLCCFSFLLSLIRMNRQVVQHEQLL